MFHGAEINCFDAIRNTPLHLAAVKGNLPLINTLLDAGADILLKNEFNRTAVHRAFFYGHAEAAHLLVERAGEGYDIEEIKEVSLCRVMCEAVSLLHMSQFWGA